MISGKEYLEHRLAWFYMTGVWPAQVDHKNTVKSDNRFTNLRGATTSQNNRNRVKPRRNKSGQKGVTERKRSGNWEANITVQGKDIYLGKFPTLEKAADAYNAAALKYHGEFARLDL